MGWRRGVVTSIHLRETKEGNFKHQKGWRIQRDDGVGGRGAEIRKKSQDSVTTGCLGGRGAVFVRRLNSSSSSSVSTPEKVQLQSYPIVPPITKRKESMTFENTRKKTLICWRKIIYDKNCERKLQCGVSNQVNQCNER